jgi:hypothetical protein
MEISKPDYTYLWSSGGSIVAPSNVKVQTGWTAEVPPFQWENWSQNRQDTAIAHILQKGISVWSSTGEYYFTTSGERSYVQGSDGNIYVAVTDSVGQNPTTDATDTYWTIAFVTPAALVTAQSLGGAIIGDSSNLKMSVTTASATASMTADSVVVGSSLGGLPYKINSVSKSINLSTTGVGGMDTGTAPASGFVSLYLIYNPTTQASALLACNQTTSSGTIYSGANMPSGYTASALVSAWRTNGSSQFIVGSQVGRSISIASIFIVVTSVNQTNTPVSITSLVPSATKTITGLLTCTTTTSSSVSVALASTAAVGVQQLGVVPPVGVVAPLVTGVFSKLSIAELGIVYLTTNATSGTMTSTASLSEYTI